MANITSSKPLLRNAEEIAGNLVRKPRPKGLRPVRTGLLPPKEETGAEIASMGPITPLGQPAQPGAPAGTTPLATPEEAAGAGAATLPPLDPAILKAAEHTPEMAAFKAALDAPAPVFQKVAFTLAERMALGFLAGLKGIDAVMPVIEARRREVSDVYQKAVEARGERLQGLMQLGQMSMQARETARTNAEQERAAGFEREKFGEEKRQFGVTTAAQAEERRLRHLEIGEARAMRLQMRREPPPTAIQDYNETNTTLDAITKIRGFVKGGAAGPLMTGTALTVNLIPGVRSIGQLPNNREMLAQMSILNTMFATGLLGKTIPAGERGFIQGIIRNEWSQPNDILNAISIIEKHTNGYREGLRFRYDFGPVAAPRDSEGLTVQMHGEIDALVKDGYRYLYATPDGNRVYQKGDDLVEVIPDAR